MKLLDDLKSKRLDALSNHALKIAEDLEEMLIESAKRGYKSFNLKINGRDDAHMLIQPEFLSGLGTMLEGCKVEVRSEEYKPILGKAYSVKHLFICW